MLTPARQEELEAIAYEIFEALSSERYEPSERGAGWAPTDKGYQDVIHILSRAKAIMWDRPSPAERRLNGIATRKLQQEQAQRVAAKLLGVEGLRVSRCIYCGNPIFKGKENVLWIGVNKDSDCSIRVARGDGFRMHVPKGERND